MSLLYQLERGGNFILEIMYYIIINIQIACKMNWLMVLHSLSQCVVDVVMRWNDMLKLNYEHISIIKWMLSQNVSQYAILTKLKSVILKMMCCQWTMTTDLQFSSLWWTNSSIYSIYEMWLKHVNYSKYIKFAFTQILHKWWYGLFVIVCQTLGFFFN